MSGEVIGSSSRQQQRQRGSVSMEGVNLEHYYHSPDYYQYFHNYEDYMGQYYMHYLMNTENISEVSMSKRQGVTQDFETGGQN